MHKRSMIGIALITVVVMAPARAVLAQNDRLQKIKQRLSALEEQDSSPVARSTSSRLSARSFSLSWGSACFAGSGHGTPVATSGSGSRQGSSSTSSRCSPS